MNSSITLNLPAALLAFVKEEAEKFDLSVEEWLTRELDVQRKLQQETRVFFAERAQGADHEGWQAIMAKVPNAPPMPGDELR